MSKELIRALRIASLSPGESFTGLVTTCGDLGYIKIARTRDIVLGRDNTILVIDVQTGRELSRNRPLTLSYIIYSLVQIDP